MLFQIVFTKNGSQLLQDNKPTDCGRINDQLHKGQLSEPRLSKLDISSLNKARNEFCEPKFTSTTTSTAPAPEPRMPENSEAKGEWKITNFINRFRNSAGILDFLARKKD